MKSQTFLEFMNELRSKMLADIFCFFLVFFIQAFPPYYLHKFFLEKV